MSKRRTGKRKKKHKQKLHESPVMTTAPTPPDKTEGRGDHMWSLVWNFITSWHMVELAGVSLILLGFGVLSMTPPRSMFAIGLFSAGFFVIILRLAWWVLFERPEGAWQKSLFIALLFGAAGFLWFWCSEFAKSTASPERAPFAIEVQSKLTSLDRGHGGLFWVASNLNGSIAMSPVNVALYLQITNTQSLPNTITGYSLEALSEDGQWVKLVRLPTAWTTPFALLDGQTLGSPLRDDTHLIDRMVLNKNIQPGEPVAGWAFFEYPDLGKPTKYQFKYKIHLIDSSGKEFKSDEIPNTRLTKEDATQLIGIGFGPKNFDTSNIRRKYWDEP